MVVEEGRVLELKVKGGGEGGVIHFGRGRFRVQRITVQ